MADFMSFKNAMFLVAAYGVFWLGTFIYIFTIGVRQRSLERDLETLEALVKKDH